MVSIKNTPGIVIVSAEKLVIHVLNFINAKNLFNIPNTYFKSQYRIYKVSCFTTFSSA